MQISKLNNILCTFACTIHSNGSGPCGMGLRSSQFDRSLLPFSAEPERGPTGDEAGAARPEASQAGRGEGECQGRK